jgi:hypothetical protein
MWIRAGEVGGGAQLIWILIKFYNIIIKFANVDKGGGNAYPHYVDKKNVLF